MKPPAWDLSPYFAGVDDPAFAAAHESLIAGIARLGARYDQAGIRRREPSPPTTEEIAEFEAVLAETNAVQDQVRLLVAYLTGLVSADTTDDVAASRLARLQADLAPLRTLATRLAAWIESVDPGPLIERSDEAAAHAWPLRKAARGARHQLSEAEEDLAAELALSGSTAWTRLHGDLTGRLTARVRRPGKRATTLPMTAVRNLAMDADAATRRAALAAELPAWESVAVPLAAALNGVKGETVVLNRRRGLPDALAPALHANAVDRETLDAMHEAVVESFPDFRRYLRAKSALLGNDGPLPWSDLFAPVGSDTATLSWDEAAATVRSAFGTYSPQLAGLAERAFRERWVDAAVRPGKRGGAFCMSTRDGESRILMSFGGTFDSASTLAHELGHAYHNHALAGRTPLQRQTPMALAETASIFCETVLVQAGLRSATEAEQLALLDTDLTGATQVVVDIHSRFLFESELFERRANAPLSVAELCDAMTRAQLVAYGDGVDPATLHPFMWAVKPHYYSSAFYNWPYTFGLLFGIGLFAVYQADPDRFRAGYDSLLSSTGLDDAAGLAARFDIDVRDAGFWRASLDVIRTRIDRFVALASGR